MDKCTNSKIKYGDEKRKRLEPPQALLGVAKVDAHLEHCSAARLPARDFENLKCTLIAKP